MTSQSSKASQPAKSKRVSAAELEEKRKAVSKAATRRKLIKWLVLCAGLSVVPIGFDVLVQLFSGKMVPFDLISNGSAYLIAFAMSAAAHGELRFDRIQSGRADYVHLRNTYLCGGVTLLSALLYALNKAAESSGKADKALVVTTSAIIWLVALIVGWQAVSASERDGKGAADGGS